MNHGVVKYSCNECHFQASSLDEIGAHIESTHINLCCPQCQYETTTEESLHLHAQTHEFVILSQSQLKCPKCDFKTSNKFYLPDHIKDVHEGEEKYTCNQCEKQFRLKGRLTQHITKKHGGVKYPCNLCGIEVTMKKNLRKRVYNNIYLRKHMKEIHGVSFACPQCEFVTKSDRSEILKRHMRTHEGVRCHYNRCEFRAKEQVKLQRHIEEKHKQECKENHKYKCEYCDYSTPSGYKYLIRHMRAEHPSLFFCDTCERKIIFNGISKIERNFKKHKENCHRVIVRYY